MAIEPSSATSTASVSPISRTVIVTEPRPCDLAAALQREVALGESRERIVQGLLLEALRGRTSAPRPVARTRVAVAGSLRQLLDAGLIAEDDEIRYTEVRRRKVHVGRIGADGRIQTEMGVHTSPSTALR